MDTQLSQSAVKTKGHSINPIEHSWGLLGPGVCVSSATVTPIQKDDSPNAMYSSRIVFPQIMQVVLCKIFFQFF